MLVCSNFIKLLLHHLELLRNRLECSRLLKDHFLQICNWIVQAFCLRIQLAHLSSRFLNFRLDLFELRWKIMALIIYALLYKSLYSNDLSFPIVYFVLVEGLRFSSEKVLPWDFRLTNFCHPDVIAKNSHFLCQTGLVLVFWHFIECVTHDGDKHVKNGDLREKGGTYEDNPYQFLVHTFVPIFKIKLSKGE